MKTITPCISLAPLETRTEIITKALLFLHLQTRLANILTPLRLAVVEYAKNTYKFSPEDPFLCNVSLYLLMKGSMQNTDLENTCILTHLVYKGICFALHFPTSVLRTHLSKTQ